MSLGLRPEVVFTVGFRPSLSREQDLFPDTFSAAAMWLTVSSSALLCIPVWFLTEYGLVYCLSFYEEEMCLTSGKIYSWEKVRPLDISCLVLRQGLPSFSFKASWKRHSLWDREESYLYFVFQALVERYESNWITLSTLWPWQLKQILILEMSQ